MTPLPLHFHTVVLVIIVVTVMSRKKKQIDREQPLKQDDGDEWDKKRHFTYEIKKAVADFTTKHMRENDIDEEFAEGAVVNLVYKPGGTVIENPYYMVSYRIIIIQ